ncbi:MAG: hypothetical protein A2991_02195 [Candidatus Terrybacteria bacterium RIFCSPLOWO2_01_FULL_58_14]|uniref:NAD kinase n=2 Tax=Candidatus Terryibacteriota TaxID=1817920 RepID=A0A1G2Q106_9BACT|nr:MAG: hypothetical protein A2682_03545 [Candidatus Terrybacteria bacterium RIFCSPHIGHO2_01_FULL_58_15]OHA53699.1 MAG: hypothetical protein A2991_02195 [Candidatus Terrybacteria bacterium RIFCSPLOWO2_01_FULL_58_14]
MFVQGEIAESSLRYERKDSVAALKVSHVAIVVDGSNERAVDAAHAARDAFSDSPVATIDTFSSSGTRGRFVRGGPEKPDLILVFGGDRTLLKAVQGLWQHQVPFMGVAYGRVGALSNDPETFSLAALRRGAYRVHSFPLLRFQATDLRDGVIEGVAVNDIVLRGETQIPGSAHLRIWVNGERFIDELMGDGFLIATPLGSTAYNINAGGPVLDPALSVIGTTVITAAAPGMRKRIVHAPTARIAVEVLRSETQRVNLSFDSEAYAGVKNIEAWLEQKGVRLAFRRKMELLPHLERLERRLAKTPQAPSP